MSLLERPKLSVLVEELHDVKTKWYSIGIQLQVPESKLDEIENAAREDLERAFRRMIQEWLKQINPEPTWTDIVKVLRCRSINEQRLAKNLERRFCKPSAASSATPHDATDSATALATWSANTASGSEYVQDPAVRREIEDLYHIFKRLRMDVYRFLSKEPLDLKEFRVFVSFPPPAWKKKQQKSLSGVDLDRIMKSNEFHEIYMVVTQYVDWYNYELLKSIVEEYGNPPIKQQMQDYCTKVDEFEERTSLEAVKNIPFCQPQSDSVALIARMPYHQCHQFHLSEIRKMGHALADEADIEHAAVRAHMVVQSSVEIIFLVPLALAPYLMVRSICPLLTSQDPLPGSVYDRCVHVIETEEAFRLMGRSLPPPVPALPAPSRQRSSVSLSSSYSDEPRPKPLFIQSSQPTLDPYHVQIFHNKVLDAGVSTVVCKARLNHLPCVAKYVHPKLVESNEWPLNKFLEGCKFLESCHHPNIVTFLGTHYDSSLRVPILLMEKMDQSLHNYLEQATHPIPIHAQLDICHDIAQGLEYIHSRGYIHGDLTATNILLQGRRAKIGGMMTLQCKSPDVELSLCPGTPAYMPMRSFSFPDYDESIDCFSFGVLAIHIATGEMPSPISHSTELSGENERYGKSIAKLHTDHPMYSIILQCLKDQSIERPSVAILCDEISVMKEALAYKTSLFFETFHLQVLSHCMQQQLYEKNEELNIMKYQHQVELHEAREAERQDAERKIASVTTQTKERMEASFKKEEEKLKRCATEEKTKLERDLKREIERIMSVQKEVEKEKQELETQNEEEKRDMQKRNDDLLSKLKQLESIKQQLESDKQQLELDKQGLQSDKQQLESDKQELRGKLVAADRSYADLLQQQLPAH